MNKTDLNVIKDFILLDVLPAIVAIAILVGIIALFPAFSCGVVIGAFAMHNRAKLEKMIDFLKIKLDEAKEHLQSSVKENNESK